MASWKPSLDTTGHFWTQRDCDSVLKACTGSSRTKPQCGEGEGAQSPPVPKHTHYQEDLCNWYLPGKKTLLSPDVWSANGCHSAHSRAGPMSQSGWSTPKAHVVFAFLSYSVWLLSILLVFCFVFVFGVVHLFVLIFCCFFFLWERGGGKEERELVTEWQGTFITHNKALSSSPRTTKSKKKKKKIVLGKSTPFNLSNVIPGGCGDGETSNRLTSAGWL